MTYTVVWLPDAMASFRRLRKDYPAGIDQLAKAVGSLAVDPYPDGYSRLGSSEFYRLRLGEYRVLYEVVDDQVAIYIVKVGRVQAR